MNISSLPPDTPPELRSRLEAATAGEPEWPTGDPAPTSPAASSTPFRLRTFLTRYRARLLLSVGLISLRSLAQNAGPLIVAAAIDHGIGARDMDALLRLCALYFAMLVLTAVFAVTSANYSGRLGQQLIYDLRLQVFAHLQQLPLSYYVKEKAGRIMAVMTGHIDALSAFLQDGLANMALQGITTAVMIAALFYMNWQLACIVLLAIVPGMYAATRWFRRSSRPRYGTVRQRMSDLTATFMESMSGIRTIAAHGIGKARSDSHTAKAGDYRGANEAATEVSSAYAGLTEVIGIAGQAVVALIGYQMIQHGSLSLGELAAFVLFLGRFFAPIQALLALYNGYQSAQAAATKIAEVLAIAPAVRELPGTATPLSIAGGLRCEAVSFGYAGSTVLRDVNIDIRPGETVALVGPTGAGKSTFARLLVRLHEPDLGRILIDGVDLRDIRVGELRRAVLLVPQETFLFHATLRENLTFGNPEADAGEIAAVCTTFGLDTIIAKLPRGLESPCYERGNALSSGERQLVALARAFLANPRVLILDEATSSLDPESERRIDTALATLLSGRTSVVIAHRLSTVRRADRIFAIDQGRIEELDSYESLLQRDALLRELATAAPPALS